MAKEKFRFPGIPAAMDGNTAAIMCERESTDAAGAYPITPSTQMGEYFQANAAEGHLNVAGRPLIFIEPEGEHASAAVTAGLSMAGLRASNFSSGQGIAYMHESLYAAVGKRLTYVLNMGCRAMTKASLSVHAGHDDYHAIDDTGFFQLFAKDVQQVADLNVLAHRIAELALTPGVVAQDGFLTTHMIESLLLPERELIAEFLGLPEDIIDCPTEAQKLLFGPRRRRVPELWDVDNPVLAGPVQNQESYMQQVAAQRPFFFDPILNLAESAFAEYYRLTGRRYAPIEGYRIEDAEYLIMGQGSLIPNAEAVADFLRKRGIRVGVLNLILWRPFPGRQLADLLRGRKGVTVLERLDQPLAEDLPMMREVRSVLGKCLENARGAHSSDSAHPGYPAYGPEQAPLLYSGCFGMGSRDLQPEALIGAVENMLEGGAKKRFFYLSIDFLHREPATPKQEIYTESLQESFPGIGELAVRGSENPNLMPPGSITVRIHSIGGWGAIATGKSLTMTLADILGYYIKSNPKYGAEKKGQPTTYYLSVAPEPVKVNCEYYYVDVVLSPDPNVFLHSNPLAGLKRGGIFIIQSDLGDPKAVWASIPPRYRKLMVEQELRCFYVDALKIAREEAGDPELLYRMQGVAFQGAFFKASTLMQETALSEEALFEKIETQLRHKFGAKGEQVVADNLRAVRRGFAETTEIEEMPLEEPEAAQEAKEFLPAELKRLPSAQVPASDIHRFWEETGYFYHTGKSSRLLSDPFVAMSLMPAGTGIFRDLTGIRFEHPEFLPEKCTGCGDCWTVCPDSAVLSLVNELGEVFETVIDRLERKGHEFTELRKAVRPLEGRLRARFDAVEEDDVDVRAALKEAVEESLEGASETLKGEFALLEEELGDLQFAITKPYYRTPEKEAKGAGGLLSITVNPYTCKGCMECVEVCGDEALKAVPQTDQSVAQLRRRLSLWHALPTTQDRFKRIDDLEEAIGALEGLLLDKGCYLSMVGGDGACLGCSEKSLLHLFTATVTALMQPRVKAFLERLEGLIGALEAKIHGALTVHFDDPSRLEKVVAGLRQREVTLAEIAERLDPQRTPVDMEWLGYAGHLLHDLKELAWKYREGVTGRGRCHLGFVNATGCSSVWGSSYPLNPYPFPWVNHLFQDSPSIALGVFEGHMRKMAENFKLVRRAEVELEEREAEDLTYFGWEAFSDEELLLCPPVVTVGGDGAMYDIGFQNLSRLMMTGKPIKVVVLDTQVYSNTGGQACTSSFKGQVADMASYGRAILGKQEVRKEIGLIGMAHRTSYVMQSSLASAAHLMEGFIEGLMSRRPALFNLFCSCQPEHGIADDASVRQARLALESRAYPFFRYNPDKGDTPPECFDLDGNPDPDRDWPTYELKYRDEGGEEQSMEIALTFADYAATEGRFRPHFKPIPRQNWDDEKMKAVSEYLALDPDEREELLPFVWALDNESRLSRLEVSSTLIEACEDRLNFWKILKAVAGVEGGGASREELAEQIKGELLASLTKNLIALAQG